MEKLVYENEVGDALGNKYSKKHRREEIQMNENGGILRKKCNKLNRKIEEPMKTCKREK